MSADFPRAGAQICPRSVRLAPEGLFVPAATLRVLLSRQRRLPLLISGYGMEPALRHGATVTVESGRTPAREDIVLCDMEGSGDLLRLRGRDGSGGHEVALDAFPRRPAMVPGERILGVVASGGRSGRLARTFGMSRVRFMWRRVE